jgi:hypothetical protein
MRTDETPSTSDSAAPGELEGVNQQVAHQLAHEVGVAEQDLLVHGERVRLVSAWRARSSDAAHRHEVLWWR